MPLNCSPKAKAFDLSNMFERMKTTGNPFVGYKDFTFKEVDEALLLMRQEADRVMQYDELTKKYTLFDKVGFDRMSTIMFNDNRGKLTREDFIQRRSKALASGTAAHDLIGKVFEHFMTNPPTVDKGTIIGLIQRNLPDSGIFVPAEDDESVDMTIFFSQEAVSDMADYIIYLLNDIEQRAMLSNPEYTIKDVHFYPEQPTADYAKNRAGHQDLLVMFPNKEAYVYDHKTSLRLNKDAKSGMSNKGMYNPQIQGYMRGNRFMGVNTIGGFIAPIMLYPNFSPNIPDNQVRIDKLFSPVYKVRKPSPSSFKLLAVNTNITSDPALAAAVKELSKVIAKMGSSDIGTMRNKPQNMSDGDYNLIMERVRAWRAKFMNRKASYRDLFQAITVNYDLALLNQLYLMVEQDLKDIREKATETMAKLHQKGANNYMDHVFEVQETLRALSSIKLEIEGLESFFNSNIAHALDNMAENWDVPMIENAFGNFMYNLSESPFRSGTPNPIMVLYYDPQGEPGEMWYNGPTGEVGKDSRLVRYTIDLDDKIMFYNPRYSGGRVGFFREDLKDGTWSFRDDILKNKDFFKFLLNPQNFGVNRAPFMVAEKTAMFNDDQGRLDPLFNGPITEDVFFRGLSDAIMSYMDRGDSYFSDLLNRTNSTMQDLIIHGVSTAYLTFKDDPKKAKVIFRSMNINEEWLTSAELINHPYYIMRTNLTESVNFHVMRNAQARMKQINQVMINFKRWYKENGMGENKATELLVDTGAGIFHRKYTDDFMEAIDNAHINQDGTFFFKNFDVDLEAYNEWYDEAYAAAVERYGNNDKMLEDWEGRHQFHRSTDGELSEGWHKRNMMRFLKVKPSRYDDVMTPEYNKIRNTPELLAVYNVFLELTKDANRVMGDNVANIMADEAFLPMYHAEFSEQLMNIYHTGNGFSSAGDMLSAFGESIVDGARTSPVDPVVGFSAQGDLANVQIPFMGYYPLVATTSGGLANMTKEERAMNADKMSFALHSVATAFTYSLYTYEQLKLTEPMAQAIRYAIKSDRYLENASKTGTELGDASGRPLQIAGSDANQTRKFAERLERWIFYDWYGIRYLSAKREDNDTMMTDPRVGTGKGPITMKSFFMFMRNMYSRNVLGVAVIPSIAAFSAGVVSGYVNSAEHVLYDEKGFKKGMKGMFSSAHRARTRRIGQYFNIYNTPTKEQEAMAHKSVGKKFFSDWYLYGPLRTADYWTTDILLTAVLDYHGLDKYGNVVELTTIPKEQNPKPLSEYFQYNDDTEELTVDEIMNDPKIWEQLRYRMTKATRDTYGQLPESQKIGLQFYYYGTMALTFSSWVPGILNKRFKSPSFDPRMNNIEMGRYRGIAQALGTKERATFTLKGMLDIIKSSLKFMVSVAPFTPNYELNEEVMRKKAQIWAENNKEDARAATAGAANQSEANQILYDMYKESVFRAVQSMVIELRFISLIYMAAYLIRLDYDDDDVPLYQEYYASRQLFKVLAKTHSELVFMLNPKEISRFLNQPVPAFGIFKDAIRVIENTGDEAIDFITGRDDARDQSPIGYYSSRFLMMNQIRKVIELYDQDKENPYWQN